MPFLQRLPLSRDAVDRDTVTRERDGALEQLWGDDSTRVLVLSRGRALLSAPHRLALLPVAAVPRPETRVYLGRSTIAGSVPIGTPVIAIVIDEEAAESFEGEWGDLRALGHLFDALDAGLFTEALAMANWHASHRFSHRSGVPLETGKSGWVRIDPADGREIFPRTDPAVIVGITDADDRLLLGANARWGGARYSLFAGFVEPGESFEAAVAREVFEEAGVRVVDPRYLGSQPWPFPASIMVGFLARLDPSTPQTAVADGVEIVDVRWFTRDELAASLDEIGLPGPTSIARAIIEEWYGGPLDDGSER